MQKNLKFYTIPVLHSPKKILHYYHAISIVLAAKGKNLRSLRRRNDMDY